MMSDPDGEICSSGELEEPPGGVVDSGSSNS